MTEDLQALHAEGLTNGAIAERLGLTRVAVLRQLRALGLRSHRTGLGGRRRLPASQSPTVSVAVSRAELAAVDAVRGHLSRGAYLRRRLGLEGPSVEPPAAVSEVGDLRDQRLTAWVSPLELDVIDTAADLALMGRSGYLRWAVGIRP